MRQSRSGCKILFIVTMLFYSKHKKVVLLFHRILPERDLFWDPIDPVLFTQTLRYITRNFQVISLDELLFEPETRSSKPLAAPLADGSGNSDRAAFAG